MPFLALALATTVFSFPTQPLHKAHQSAQLPTSSVSRIGMMPKAVTSFGAAHTPGWIYTLGGFHGRPHRYNSEGQSSSFARMSLDDGSWEELPSPGAMQSVALLSHGSWLYRVGGMSILNAPGDPQALESSSSFERFDPLSNEWSSLADLPTPRSSHMAVVDGDTLWVAGGWRLSLDEEPVWHESILSFDLSQPEGSWTEHAAPMRRRALGVASLESRLVVLGGMSDEGIRKDLHVFDPTSGEWSQGPDYPGSPFGVSTTSLEGVLYASGSDGQVYSWTLGDEAWNSVTSLIFPRFFHQLIHDEHSLFAIGGIGASGRVRHVEQVDLRKEASELRSTVWSTPRPGLAVNRQGAFLQGDDLIVFGGNRSMGQHSFEQDDFLDEAFKLNLASMRWSRIEAFPVHRQSMQAAVGRGGSVGLAVGGFGHDGEVSRSHAASFEYNVRSDMWTETTHGLPEARSQFAVVEYDSHLWVFGGLNYDPRLPKEEQFFLPTEVLSCSTEFDNEGAWNPTEIHLPEGRRAAGVAVLGHRCYLIGGMRDGFAGVDACDVFNFETKEWETIPAPRRARISPELVAMGGKLYLSSGSSNAGEGMETDASLEVFDPVTQKWSVLLEEIPVPAKHLQMFAYRDRLLMYSPHRDDEFVQVALIDVGTRQLEGPVSDSAHSIR